MASMYVAAGGGGDVIAAAVCAAVDDPDSTDPVIAAWAWERLMVDPLPGPRGCADFDHLDQPAPGVHLVTPGTRPRSPAGSNLPRLAADLGARVVLLDPVDGAPGLAEQLIAAAAWCGADHLEVIDVGGDVLAHPGDPGVRSPLADVTSVVAAHHTGLGGRVTVLGPGCDGELAADLVRNRLVGLGSAPSSSFKPEVADRVLPVLSWHPSEGTALFVAAVLGARGRAEIRDRGLPVVLDDQTPTAWTLDVAAAQPPHAIADNIWAARSLADLEDVFDEAYGIREIDYERVKAASRDRDAPNIVLQAEQVTAFLAEARERNVQWVTRRRILEAFGASRLTAAALPVEGQRRLGPLISTGLSL